MLVAISLLYFYIACIIKVNLLSGILVNLFCSILVIFFRSYSLFYTSLIILLITSYRYYSKKKKRIDFSKLLSIFVLNLINIIFSVYAVFQMIYYYPAKYSILMYMPFANISLIEAAPIVYIIMIYFLIIILILSIHSHLLIDEKNNMQHTIIKITVSIISIVMLVVVVNAFIYYIIHNFPMSQTNTIFDGNFLKDPVKYYYRSPKPFSDCLWFSATTFFTVGYGDMHPVGNIMYLLSMMEMVSAYVLGIIIIPIILFKVSK